MRRIGIILSVSFLAACNQTTGKEFSTSAASEIQVGKSTKTTVEARLGKPESTHSQPNGDVSWIYDYAKIDTGGAGAKAAGGMGLIAVGSAIGSMLPIPGVAMLPAAIGATAMNSSNEMRTDKTTLTVKFNKKSIVTHCALNVVNTKINSSGGAFFTPATYDSKQSTSETNCVDIPKEQPQPTTVASASPSIN